MSPVPMMPVAALLDDATLHHPVRFTHRADYDIVLAACRWLDDSVFASHQLRVHVVRDIWQFRDLLELGCARLDWPHKVSAFGERGIAPILGRHVDPVFNRIDAGDFYGLVGLHDGTRLPLITTNSGRRYDLARLLPEVPTLRRLLESQRLYADRPDRDAPYLSLRVESDDPALDAHDGAQLVHVGTAWVTPRQQGGGLARRLVRLNRSLAWILFGHLRVLGTVESGRGHDHVFGAVDDVGSAICERRPTAGDVPPAPLVQRLHLYQPRDVLAQAREVVDGVAFAQRVTS